MTTPEEIHALTEKYEGAQEREEQHQKGSFRRARSQEQAIKEADQHGTRLRRNGRKRRRTTSAGRESVRGRQGRVDAAAAARCPNWLTSTGSTWARTETTSSKQETVDEDAEDDDVPEKKAQTKSKSKKKQKKQTPADEEEEENEENEGEEGLGIMSGQKKKRKKRKRVEEDGEEEQTDDRDAKPTAAECYRKLQIKGPRELYLVVDQME